ncbi:Protein of unknown function [Andreprevotia lacus DSM 23236]|jgi:hypothetical protein|uniref:DUF2782 domain-containing protein n=1 Tax=Andreprevotia lacus DSM 23236 TaxID=1121001 RepID=A0A1W1XCE8_9NEIS|nr:DUF2782 domain-containing protein [Andreprevotia lacus]SMC21464.1 Protein of unknown function [Andreprevotia lacus DSM 23236]
MKKRLLPLVSTLLALGLLAGPLRAADKADVPPPPPIPAGSTTDPNQPEPEVRIIEKGDATIAEYRLKGRLYKIKVTPKIGAPYYLIDSEGKGNFIRSDGLGSPELIVPQWVLFEF